MGGFVCLAATRGCRVRNILLAGALALAVLATPLAGSALAATSVVARDSGLTAPGGMALTPATEPGGPSGIWVADELYGVCRIAPTPDSDAGNAGTRNGRLVLDTFCAPEPPDPPLGAPPLDPAAAERPSGAFQIAFDRAGCALAADRCNFYVAEGTSGGSGVWRMHWDATTGTIDSALKIYDDPAGDRVMGIALTPGGDVDFSTKRTAIIRRLVEPASAGKLSYRNPPVYGQSQAPGVASLAHLGAALYLADAGTVTKIADPRPTGSTTAVPVAGAPTGVSAVAADPAKGIVYAGTNTGALNDAVHAVTDSGSAEYDTGFANVTAIALDADGAIFTADDAAAAAGVVNSSDQARIFHTPANYETYPRVALVATPPSPTKGTAPEALTIGFRSRAGVAFECRFGQKTLADTQCGDDGAGNGEFAPGALVDGTYQFTVRAVDAATGAGPVVRFGFTVDNTGPVLRLDPNAPSVAVGGAIRFAFSSEIGTAFECRLDSDPFQPCGSPKGYAGLALGSHRLEVTGTDAAGNAAAEPIVWTFTSVPAPAVPVTPAPEQTPGGGAAAPAAAAALIPAAPATVGATATTAPAPAGPAALAAPIVVQASPRVPRQDIGVPCVAVSPLRERARLSLSGIEAMIRFRAPSQARYAKFTLRRSSSRRRGARVVETVGYASVRAAGARHTTRIALTRSQRRQVRSGHLRLAVAYGTCRTQVGEWEWLTTSTQGGSHR
ncbi:MAG: large repetitive protein [Gaiellaceae bacterium]|nr:large repetitive protein [Gaiellaceae bacterium]